MKTIKFALNPHQRKELKRDIGYLNRNYVKPARELINKLESNSSKKLYSHYTVWHFSHWLPFLKDKRRLDYEIGKALLEIEMAYKTVLPNGEYLNDDFKYMYRW